MEAGAVAGVQYVDLGGGSEVLNGQNGPPGRQGPQPTRPPARPTARPRKVQEGPPANNLKAPSLTMMYSNSVLMAKTRSVVYENWAWIVLGSNPADISQRVIGLPLVLTTFSNFACGKQ